MTSAAPPQIVRDLMLTTPKTLSPAATVADVRAVLDNPHVQMVLLGDGALFRGAITHLPDGAAPGESALHYLDKEVETIGPDEPATTAYTRAKASPYRRVVVLDDDQRLLGLLCLNRKHTGFCGGAPLRLDD